MNNDTMLLSAVEAAASIGISRSLFYELHAEGKVPAPIRLGKRVLWRKDELRAWVDSGCPNRGDWECRSTRLSS